MPKHEYYISVDVETAGPFPGRYALLSIGACAVFQPDKTFYVELKPDREDNQPEALQISGLNLETLKHHGQPPNLAMRQFSDWLEAGTPAGKRPVFVAFNATFDWAFVNEYFHRYLGHNPFGHSALDMKAYYMGLRGVPWSDTGMDAVSKQLQDRKVLSHHALQDALDQAVLFKLMLKEGQAKNE